MNSVLKLEVIDKSSPAPISIVAGETCKHSGGIFDARRCAQGVMTPAIHLRDQNQCYWRALLTRLRLQTQSHSSKNRDHASPSCALSRTIGHRKQLGSPVDYKETVSCPCYKKKRQRLSGRSSTSNRTEYLYAFLDRSSGQSSCHI